MRKGKKMRNGFIHPSEHLALEAEDAVFAMNEHTQEACESMDRRMDTIQKKIDTKYYHRRKGDKNEEPTSS